MKKCYSLVVSVFDENGNRIEAIEICGSNSKKKIKKEKNQLEIAIRNGEYDEYANFDNGESMVAEIEAHDDESYELLWIE